MLELKRSSGRFCFITKTFDVLVRGFSYAESILLVY